MYIALDIETTGFNPITDEIIEIGAVKFNDRGEIINKFQMLINPQKKIPKFVKHITGIDDYKVKNAKIFPEIKKELKKFIGKHPIIGHNIEFDTNFLKSKGIKLKNDEYDTLILSSAMYRSLTSYSLETLANNFELKNKNTHRALDDALLSMELFLGLTNEYQKIDKPLVKEIIKLAKKSKSPLKSFFKKIYKNKFKYKINLKSKIKKFKKSKFKNFTEKNENSLIEIDNKYSEIIKGLENKKNILISTSKEIFDNYKGTKLIKKDIYSNYISNERLNKLLKQKKITKEEFSAIMKILIWNNESKNHLLSELELFGKEKKILKLINQKYKTNKEKLKQNFFLN